MKAVAVTERITQLTRLHFVNAFLVHEDDGLTIATVVREGNGNDNIHLGAGNNIVAAGNGNMPRVEIIAVTALAAPLPILLRVAGRVFAFPEARHGGRL